VLFFRQLEIKHQKNTLKIFPIFLTVNVLPRFIFETFSLGAVQVSRDQNGWRVKVSQLITLDERWGGGGGGGAPKG
jgi:hypothetical protein